MPGKGTTSPLPCTSNGSVRTRSILRTCSQQYSTVTLTNCFTTLPPARSHCCCARTRITHRCGVRASFGSPQPASSPASSRCSSARRSMSTRFFLLTQTLRRRITGPKQVGAVGPRVRTRASSSAPSCSASQRSATNICEPLATPAFRGISILGLTPAPVCRTTAPARRRLRPQSNLR